MPPTQMMSWGTPAARSARTGSRARETLPFGGLRLLALELPLVDCQPELGASGKPWLKSDGWRWRGVLCFVRTMVVEMEGNALFV